MTNPYKSFDGIRSNPTVEFYLDSEGVWCRNDWKIVRSCGKCLQIKELSDFNISPEENNGVCVDCREKYGIPPALHNRKSNQENED